MRVVYCTIYSPSEEFCRMSGQKWQLPNSQLANKVSKIDLDTIQTKMS